MDNVNNNTSNFATSLPKTIAFRPSSGYVIPQQVIIIFFNISIYLLF